MQTPTFRIVGPSGATLADDLPISAPAIQLHEGAVAEKGATLPKNLAPGESVAVLYPLDAERGRKPPTIRLTVTRTDAVEMPNDGTTPAVCMLPSPEHRPAVGIDKNRGGRRSRGGKTS